MAAGTYIRSADDVVRRPPAGWWIAVGGGLALLALLAFDSDAYALWAHAVTMSLSQALLRVIFAAAVLTHAAEAIYALRLARRSGLDHSAIGWCLQTFVLGFPSLRLLSRVARQRR